MVFIVLDQLRPEFIDAFDMQNVKHLMKDGTSFPKAYLGHMASETVVSHNVMTSGILPKHMGWSDEWFRDVDGVLGDAGKTYVSGSLSAAQFDLLIKHGGYKKLPDYLHEKFPGTIVATVGQKSYATNSMGGPGADIRVTMGSRDKDCDVDGSTATNWRGPPAPTYRLTSPAPTCANTECSRFYINSNKYLNNHGTLTTSPAWMYPLEGNRDVPGQTPRTMAETSGPPMPPWRSWTTRTGADCSSPWAASTRPVTCGVASTTCRRTPAVTTTSTWPAWRRPPTTRSVGSWTSSTSSGSATTRSWC